MILSLSLFFGGHAIATDKEHALGCACRQSSKHSHTHHTNIHWRLKADRVSVTSSQAGMITWTRTNKQDNVLLGMSNIDMHAYTHVHLYGFLLGFSFVNFRKKNFRLKVMA